MRPFSVAGDKQKRYWHLQDVDVSQHKKRKRVPAATTKQDTYTFESKLADLLGHPVDKSQPTNDK